jgi:hypothetical protein
MYLTPWILGVRLDVRLRTAARGTDGAVVRQAGTGDLLADGPLAARGCGRLLGDPAAVDPVKVKPTASRTRPVTATVVPPPRSRSARSPRSLCVLPSIHCGVGTRLIFGRGPLNKWR